MKNFWHTVYFGFQTWELAWLGFTLVVGLIASIILSKVLLRVIRRYVVKTLKAVSIESYFSSSHYLASITTIFLGWIWYFGSTLINFSAHDLKTIGLAAKTLSYLGISWTIWQSADVLKQFLLNKDSGKKSQLDALIGPLVSKLVHIAAILFGIVSFTELFNLPIASLLTGLGLGGFAIAMAAKETVGNIFGSATILIDRPFQIGDWVKIGDVEGNVEAVGFRSTRVRTFYDSLVTIPNANLQTAIIDNMGARKYRRIKFPLHLDLSTNSDVLQNFCEAIREHLASNALIKQSTITVALQDVSPTLGIHVLVSYFLKTLDSSQETLEKHATIQHIIQLASTMGVRWKQPS